ncbi:MAG: hypothetical protein R3A51_04135 [Nannocystaceae bacterium]
MAVVGGCVGVEPRSDDQLQLEVLADDRFRVLRLTFIGGCNRGREEHYTVRGQQLEMQAGAYNSCKTPFVPESTSLLTRVATFPTNDPAALTGDSRRAVAAAALESVANRPPAAPCPPNPGLGTLLTSRRARADPALVERAIEVVRDVCFAPALETILVDTPYWTGRAAARSLAEIQDNQANVASLLRLLPRATESNRGVMLSLIGSAGPIPSSALPAFVALQQRSSNRVTVHVLTEMFDRMERDAPPEQRARHHFERAANATCGARVHILADEITFDVLLWLPEEDLEQLVIALLEKQDCAPSKQLAFYLGARFSHSDPLSDALWQRVGALIQSIPSLRQHIRAGLACGGSSCPKAGRCHLGDATFHAPARDKLLRSLKLPLCP